MCVCVCLCKIVCAHTRARTHTHTHSGVIAKQYKEIRESIRRIVVNTLFDPSAVSEYFSGEKKYAIEMLQLGIHVHRYTKLSSLYNYSCCLYDRGPPVLRRICISLQDNILVVFLTQQLLM